MTWKDWIIIALIAVCLWLAFDKWSSVDKPDHDKTIDSLSLIIIKQSVKIDSANRLSEYWEKVADSNRSILADQIKYSKTLKSRLYEVNTNVDKLDSSGVFRELSEWLERETGESLIESR